MKLIELIPIGNSTEYKMKIGGKELYAYSYGKPVFVKGTGQDNLLHALSSEVRRLKSHPVRLKAFTRGKGLKTDSGTYYPVQFYYLS